jgi:integral membrane sensor domain MASE1
MQTLKAGVVYFLLIFAVGWILGPIRELWAVPHFGRMAAMLSEAFIMLVAMIVQHDGSFDGFTVLERSLR